MTCGNCGRAIHEGRLACLYCGWAPSAFASTAEDGLLAPPEPLPRTYRSGASLVRFGFWSILCTGAAALLWSKGIYRPWLSAVLLLLGPIAFLPYLVRSLLVRVTVEPDEGIVLSSGRLIPWEAIASIEARGLRFQPDYRLFHFILDYIRGLPLIGDVGLLSLMTMAMMAGMSALLFLSGLLSGLMVPMFVMLSPWQPKVVLTLRDGARKVWRDLVYDIDLVHAVDDALRRRR